MTMPNIALQRLHNQRLLQTKFQTPGEVVAWMGAVQAQEYAHAKWALGLRMEKATDEVVEQAFTEGAILRTHLMRPTWHFVTPADIRWILELTAPRVQARNAYSDRELELDKALYRRSDAAIAKALRDGQHLTRPELGAALARIGIVAEGRRLGHIVFHAELEGIACSGPRRGKQFTYALLDERAPHAKTLARDEALAELTRRYFTSHGPATVQDFAWWSGLTVADTKAGLAMLGAQVSHEVIDGQTYWFSSARPALKDKAVTAHLLPVFDEYTVAYKDRSAVFDTTHTKKLGGRGDVLSNHTIVVAGQIVGSWQRTLKKEAVVIASNPFTALTAAERRAFAAAVQRYGEFLDLPVVHE